MQAARGTPVTGETTGADQPDGPGKPPPASGRGRILYLLIAVVGVGLDALTKHLVVTYLEPNVPVQVVGTLLQFRLIRNPGAAFSLGENFTIVFTVLALAVLVFVVTRLVPRLGHRGWGVALGLLTAGVAGNLIDRVFRAPSFLHGHVVDFFQLPNFAIFNVADMCITSAAVMIVVLAILQNVGIDGRRYPKPVKAAAKPGQVEEKDPDA